MSTTEWINPTDATVRFRVFESHGKDREPARWISVEIPPKGKMTLPASYDAAIRNDIKGHVIGLAPQLVKASEVPAETKPAEKTEKK